MTENYNAKNWTFHNCINSGKIRSEGWVYFLKFSNGKVYVYFCVYTYILYWQKHTFKSMLNSTVIKSADSLCGLNS